MGLWSYFFKWYSGAVWSNILASALWAVPGFFWTRHHFQKVHRRVDELHDKHDDLRKYLKQGSKKGGK